MNFPPFFLLKPNLEGLQFWPGLTSSLCLIATGCLLLCELLSLSPSHSQLSVINVKFYLRWQQSLSNLLYSDSWPETKVTSVWEVALFFFPFIVRSILFPSNSPNSVLGILQASSEVGNKSKWDWSLAVRRHSQNVTTYRPVIVVCRVLSPGNFSTPRRQARRHIFNSTWYTG